MDKKFARRISGAALAATAALALAACSSSGSSGGSSSGATTLKLVVADYGTGPSNASAKYWDGIVTAFEKAHPDIKVNVTSIPWTNFDQQVQTMIQNKQYPDITEGDYLSNYAKDGLLYSASDVLSNPGNLLPAFKAQGTYNGTQYGMPFTTSSRTLFYNKKLFTQAGITAAPSDVEVYVTVRAGSELSDFYANLRAPILVAEGQGHQVINEAADAPVRARLFPAVAAAA